MGVATLKQLNGGRKIAKAVANRKQSLSPLTVSVILFNQYTDSIARSELLYLKWCTARPIAAGQPMAFQST